MHSFSKYKYLTPVVNVAICLLKSAGVKLSVLTTFQSEFVDKVIQRLDGC